MSNFGAGEGGVAGSGGRTTGGSGGSATGGSSGSGGSGGSGGIVCTGATPSFPEFDRTCTTPDDCVLVQHITSCCGSTLVMSISSNEKDRFEAAEAICDAQYPACGCATRGMNVEDGTLIDGSQLNLVVSMCDADRCAAHYTGEAFACGDARCTPDQICWITYGGPANTPSSATCEFSGGCTDCSCANATGCDCAAQDGHVTVTCSAP